MSRLMLALAAVAGFAALVYAALCIALFAMHRALIYASQAASVISDQLDDLALRRGAS